MGNARVTKKKTKKTSLFMETWDRLTKNKLAMVGLFMLVVLVIVAIFGPLIAPYGYDDQDPTKDLIAPCLAYPFGTDNFGRDILSRIIYGSRVSLMVGLVTVFVSMTLGCTIGAIAAFYKKCDNILMRFVDIIGGIPYLLLAIAIAAALGSGLGNMMMAVGIANIPAYARITRGSVLTVKEEEYIEAARSIGLSNASIILRHIMPNALSPILVQATLGVANSILTAACLSFMGLGIQPPSPEWGAMLSAGRVYIRDAWWMTVLPGICLMLVVYALNTLGDGLRDALDPRLKN